MCASNFDKMGPYNNESQNNGSCVMEKNNEGFEANNNNTTTVRVTSSNNNSASEDFKTSIPICGSDSIYSRIEEEVGYIFRSNFMLGEL